MQDLMWLDEKKSNSLPKQNCGGDTLETLLVINYSN
jgi:hypothetical protein